MQKSEKVAAKGQKQIHNENKATIKFYSYMAFSSVLINLIVSVFFRTNSTANIFFLLFSLVIYGSCIYTFIFLSKSLYNEKGVVIDAGMDLNSEMGISEYVKDIIILVSITQSLSTISIYFWYLLLLIPFQAIYLFWVKIAAPWIFEPAPEEPKLDEKKKRKLRRKFKIYQ